MKSFGRFGKIKISNVLLEEGKSEIIRILKIKEDAVYGNYDGLTSYLYGISKYFPKIKKYSDIPEYEVKFERKVKGRNWLLCRLFRIPILKESTILKSVKLVDNPNAHLDSMALRYLFNLSNPRNYERLRKMV